MSSPPAIRRVQSIDTLPTVPVLIYDADCAFCAASARWLDRRFRDPSAGIIAWQGLDLGPLGLSVGDVTRAAWWVDETGRAVEAHAAIAAALRSGRRGWPALGVLLGHPPFAWIAAPVYRWVARNCQRMPGGSDACALPQPPGSPVTTASTSDAGRSVAEVARARIVTFGLVGLIVTASLAGLELWPLSGFRLFSMVRSSDQVSWQLRAVDSAGVETTLDLSLLPPHDSGALQATQRLATMDLAEQQGVMLAWLEDLGLDPGRFSVVRVYRVDGQVPTGSGQPTELPTTTQVFEVSLP